MKAGRRVLLVSRCANRHETSTEVHRPKFNGDLLVDGYCGSDRDFCPVCDTPAMEALCVITEP